MRPLFELSLRRVAAILAGALLAGGCSTTGIVDSAKSFGRSVADTAISAGDSVTSTAKGGVAKVADAATIKPISPEQEAQIGLSAAAMLLGAAPLGRDDALQKYVNRVGRWVAVQTGRTDRSRGSIRPDSTRATNTKPTASAWSMRRGPVTTPTACRGC